MENKEKTTKSFGVLSSDTEVTRWREGAFRVKLCRGEKSPELIRTAGEGDWPKIVGGVNLTLAEEETYP